MRQANTDDVVVAGLLLLFFWWRTRGAATTTITWTDPTTGASYPVQDEPPQFDPYNLDPVDANGGGDTFTGEFTTPRWVEEFWT